MVHRDAHPVTWHRLVSCRHWSLSLWAANANQRGLRYRVARGTVHRTPFSVGSDSFHSLFPVGPGTLLARVVPACPCLSSRSWHPLRLYLPSGSWHHFHPQALSSSPLSPSSLPTSPADPGNLSAPCLSLRLLSPQCDLAPSPPPLSLFPLVSPGGPGTSALVALFPLVSPVGPGSPSFPSGSWHPLRPSLPVSKHSDSRRHIRVVSRTGLIKIKRTAHGAADGVMSYIFETSLEALYALTI